MTAGHLGGKFTSVTKLTDILPSEMPLLLTTDGFHTYMVKLTTIGPFQNWQIQLLCANTGAWNDLERVYNAAIEIKKWIQRFDERVLVGEGVGMGGWIGRLMPRVRMGLGTALAEIINQDFVGRYELDSVNGFVDEGEGGKEGRCGGGRWLWLF